ncbi:transcription antitermination factor NusB, partial [Streptomyces sp. NPDC005921]
MAARNTARKRAFQILFEGDQRGADVLTVLADWIRLSRDDTRQPPVSEYTMQLVEGYAEHTRRIDELIAQYAVGWTLDRMPVVDRNILRLGAYELIWVDETPDAVVLDEMVQLAKEFSTDESPSFVNGLLGRLKELKRRTYRRSRRRCGTARSPT